MITTKIHIADWKYNSLEHRAVCEIDNQECVVSLCLRHNGHAFPDVNEVEAWLTERVKSPLTAETLLEDSIKSFQVSATVVLCSSKSHGLIECSNSRLASD